MEYEMIGAARLVRFLSRAEAGEELTVGFFGGSITQGSLASTETLCYAHRVVDLLSARYPKARFHYINAGIGGTGSCFGAIRLKEDLLVHEPDLVVVDFSVNDARAVLPLYHPEGDGASFAWDAAAASETDQRDAISGPAAAETGTGRSEAPAAPAVSCEETFEAVLRGILASPAKPAVIVLNNAFYDTGESVEEQHNAVADHYGVPHVSVRERILPRIRAGEFTCAELSPDNLHPNDRGHELIAREILSLTENYAGQKMTAADRLSANAELSEGDAAGTEDERTKKDAGSRLPAPCTANAYEGIRRRNRLSAEPLLEGFVTDTEGPRDAYDFFTNGWIGRSVGDRLEITLTGANLAVVYRKSIHRPAPVARLTMDGDAENAVLLDGNFDQDWGDCLYLEPILHHGRPGAHKIEVEIVKASLADQSPFYLICFGAL